MCGRYSITTAPEAMRALFRYREQPNFPPRYNVAPTQPVPIVRVVEGDRHFALVRWGLIPPWAKDPRSFTLVINARGELVNDKPAFKNAMKRRRCLFPADGFYEWRQEGRGKRPFHVRRRDGQPIAFAGLWETWMGPNGEEMETAAIVTTTANSGLATIHERMPVIVPEEAFGTWLDCVNVDARMASGLIAPAPNGMLEACEISATVNRVANDFAELIEPVPAEIAGAPIGTEKPAVKAKRNDDDQPLLFDWSGANGVCGSSGSAKLRRPYITRRNSNPDRRRSPWRRLMQLTGIHHLTAVSADAPGNKRFYTDVTRHAPGQEDREPGRRLRLSPVLRRRPSRRPAPTSPSSTGRSRRERRGTHSIVRTALARRGRATLDWWKRASPRRASPIGAIVERDGRATLDFEDPEGQRLSLVDDGGAGEAHPWDRSPVPAEHQIRGLGPITISVPDLRRPTPCSPS